MAMSRTTSLVKRSLIFVHRWLGVALSALFTLWFASGIVMMYWTFPGVTAADRLQRGVTLKPDAVTLSPEAAYAALHRDEPPASIRLTSFDGRPAYEFGAGGRGRGGARRGNGGTMVFADDGSVRRPADDAMLDRAATRWAGRPLSEANKAPVTDVDQWTVAGHLRTLRPMVKYSFADGQHVYVN